MALDTDTQPPRDAPASRDSRDVRLAQSLMRLGASVAVHSSLPLADLIALAQQAAERGLSLTLRGAHERSTADLERVAMAGRGHVTFDLAS
ncbi:hypothetical protein BURK1_01987 [Burkholderiales bacterium]|nr:hypothetical protein BURK1_01987 [Burkholderiales bacterium]